MLNTYISHQQKKNTPQIMLVLLTTEDHTFYENEGYSEKAIALTVLSSLKDKICTQTRLVVGQQLPSSY